MKTAPVSNISTPVTKAKKHHYERPYYLTRQKSAEELAVIDVQRNQTRKLITRCVGTGLGVTVLYFILKKVIFKK